MHLQRAYYYSSEVTITAGCKEKPYLCVMNISSIKFALQVRTPIFLYYWKITDGSCVSCRGNRVGLFRQPSYNAFDQHFTMLFYDFPISRDLFYLTITRNCSVAFSSKLHMWETWHLYLTFWKPQKYFTKEKALLIHFDFIWKYIWSYYRHRIVWKTLQATLIAKAFPIKEPP